jgi:peptide chain release factor subunit 1
MQTSELTPDRLRALADCRPERGLVLSLYLNLDPSEFATPEARQTAVRSLLNEAESQVEDPVLEHDEREALRGDLERVRRELTAELDADGAHGLAIFASAPAGLWETLKLSRPVPSGATVDSRPHIEPLTVHADATRWAVLLVNRRAGRIFRGTRDALYEVASLSDIVHGQHDQGGWSQARYERSVEQDVEEHLKRAAEALFRGFQRQEFDALLVGAPEELAPHAEEKLHPYLRARRAGRLTVDVEHASPDEIVEAAKPCFAEHERAREHDALDRIGEGPSAAGWDDVLEALNEKRVETLLVDGATHASGGVCPRCGWLGRGRDACPIDGTALGPRDDLCEAAIEAAVRQGGSVLHLRHHDDLVARGGLAAVLRF